MLEVPGRVVGPRERSEWGRRIVGERRVLNLEVETLAEEFVCTPKAQTRKTEPRLSEIVS